MGVPQGGKTSGEEMGTEIQLHIARKISTCNLVALNVIRLALPSVAEIRWKQNCPRHSAYCPQGSNARERVLWCSSKQLVVYGKYTECRSRETRVSANAPDGSHDVECCRLSCNPLASKDNEDEY